MKSAAWMVAVLIAILASGAAARDWVDSPQMVPGWDGRTTHHMGVSGNAVLGYVDVTQWAEEVQVTFHLPPAEYGGPWLIEYAAFYLSGTATRGVTLRDGAELEDPPGEISSDHVEFRPLDSAWPPGGWTYVTLKSGSTCPDYLLGDEGECFTVGIKLAPGDALGMASGDPECRGWGYVDRAWIDDTAGENVVAAVRIGLYDLGLSNANRSTWGEIKDLFFNR